jgi:hypothetical protein
MKTAMPGQAWVASRFGAAAVALVLGACAPGAPDQPQAPAGLLDVAIPGDFTFATAKGLTVRAEGDPAKLASTLAEIRLPTGEIVHHGPLNVEISLAIPTAVETLTVRLRGPDDTERTETIATTGDQAVVTVE